MAKTSLKPWRVVRSQHLLRDKWISVRADNCVTASGVEVSPYYVLEYPDWVHIVAIDDFGQMILVQQYRHAYGDISLELPAGGVHPEDAHVLEAGARELAEETGYQARELKLVTSFTASTSKFSNRIHVILATGATIMINSPKPDDSEDIVVHLLSISEAIDLSVTGQIVEANHISSMFLALRAADRIDIVARGQLPTSRL